MNSQGDKTSRIEQAAEQARRDYTRQAQDQQGNAFVRGITGVRHWCVRRLPGGEATLWVSLGIVALVLLGLALVPGNGMFGGRSPDSEAQPVAVAVAKKGEILVTLNATGTVTPLATATVTPQVSGQVVRVDFAEGQVVKAGDVLAQIDPRSYRASYDEAVGALAKDKAALANANVEYKRQKALFQAKATSRSDLDAAEASYKQYLGAVTADEGTVAAAKLKLDFTTVTAPISGRIGLRGVDVGNYVAAGQSTGIATITQTDPMSVLFAISESRVNEVVERMNQGAVLEVEIWDRTKTKKLAAGVLSALDSQISTTTGTVKMRALFDNADGALFPNQFVNVKLKIDTLKDLTVMPVTAIQRGSSGDYVFVVSADKDKTVSMRGIKLGAQDTDNVAVLQGLNPGETVVTDGADRLADGATVSIPSGQKVEKVEAAASAGSVKAKIDKRQLFRKLKPEEFEMLQSKTPQERKAWLEEHKAELMKRPNQPRPPGPPPGGGHGGPPPM